jgi:hypothetical protein
MYLRSSLATLIAVLAVQLTSCTGIRVRYVDYRLPGLVAGPVDHGTVKDSRTSFAATFCSALAHMVTDVGETWGNCKRYIEIDGTVTPDPPAALKPVRVLVVAGVFSECLEKSGVKAFVDAKKHLENPTFHTNISIENVPVPGLGTSANNATTIRDYVQNHPGNNFIAVGYSKGVGDWMEAIAAYPAVKNQVIALVSIAGSVGGSRVPDLFGSDLVNKVQGLVGKVGLPGCKLADGGGLTSLTRRDRQAFLQKYPVGIVPAYSVAAVATGDSADDKDDRTISSALEVSWRALRAYSLDEDSQVIADDAVVPGGTFLAIALADHWAVALPFQETTDPKERARVLKLVDRNTYPRTALLEAILRQVTP